MAERFGDISGQEPSPCRCQRLVHRRVIRCKPGKVTEPVLDDLLGAHACGRVVRRATREHRTGDRHRLVLRRLFVANDDDEAQEHCAAVAAPRRGMHERRSAEELGRKTPNEFHRVIVGTDLDIPRRRPARTGETWRSSVEAKNEHLGLDRALGPPDRVAPGGAQAGRALSRICSRVAIMLWMLRACCWTWRTSSSASPRLSTPHSHRSTKTCWAFRTFPTRTNPRPNERPRTVWAVRSAWGGPDGSLYLGTLAEQDSEADAGSLVDGWPPEAMKTECQGSHPATRGRHQVACLTR